MCDSLNTVAEKHLKIASSEVVEYRKNEGWSSRDLLVAGIPEKWLGATMYMLTKTRLHSTPLRIWISPEDVPEEIAIWALNPKGIMMDFDEAWWRDVFYWVFGAEIHHVAAVAIKKSKRLSGISSLLSSD